MKKELVIVVFLLIFSLPAVKSLFIPGGYTSHDLTHHVIRQVSMDRLLKDGQFPPRWSGELNNGYGYPLFLFNYPLPAMFGEVFHFFGLGYVNSVKAVLFSSMILSVFGMYLFLNSLLSNRTAAFLGAMFYLYAPIRFLNVYVSAAVGASLALGVLPFVFWNIVRIARGPADSQPHSSSSTRLSLAAVLNGAPRSPSPRANSGMLFGSLSFAFLILSHNVTALIFSPVLIVFSAIVGGKKGLLRIFLMFLLGLGLSAWFWLPAIVEKQYIRFDSIYTDFYKDQFITFWQLLRSPWGYGLSHPQNPEVGDMSYQLGLVHILVIIVFSIWYLISGVRKVRSLGLFVLVGFILSVFLMLKISEPVWDNLPFLSILQFPLRFSAIAIFVSSIAAALLIKHLPQTLSVIASERSERGNLIRRRALLINGKIASSLKSRLDFLPLRNDILRWILFFSLLLLVIYANRNHWNINEVFNPGEQYYLDSKATSTTYGEHLPKWGRVMNDKVLGKIDFIDGLGKFRIIEDKSVRVLAEVEAETVSKIRFNQIYFPGWQIRIDGKDTQIDYLSETKSYGLPLFDVPVGKHQILAEFKNTPIRNFADLISLASLGLVVIYLLYASRYRAGS